MMQMSVANLTDISLRVTPPAPSLADSPTMQCMPTPSDETHPPCQYDERDHPHPYMIQHLPNRGRAEQMMQPGDAQNQADARGKEDQPGPDIIHTIRQSYHYTGGLSEVC